MTIYLNKIYNWLKQNYLSLNMKKTVFMAFGSYTNSIPKKIKIFIENYKIIRVEKIKYLGVIFDPYLKWNHHIDSILKKTRYLLFLLRKMHFFKTLLFMVSKLGVEPIIMSLIH